MLLNSRGDSLVNPDGLGTAETLEFMLEHAYKRAIHVGFVWSYDTNMILRDLPPEYIRRLWQRGAVSWRGYRIRYRDRREFTVRRGARYIRVWDVFGFFQSNFVTAVQKWLDVPTAELERMKAARPSFTLAELPEIHDYCRGEVQQLAEIMTRLAEAAKKADIGLSRWDGAGAVASALLCRHAVDRYTAEISDSLEFAARAAYYGGRIELFRFGYHGKPVRTYDIRSAYPAALVNVPCLAHTAWKIVETPRWIRPDALYRVQWELRGTALPFPWRDSDGAVYFPPRGRGWYWGHELLAGREALAAGAVRGSMAILAGFLPEISCSCCPFGWVPGLFELRDTWKREGNAAEKVLKLGLNSLYGKTAQRKGGQPGKAPRWHNIVWASFVTSHVRAELYRTALPALLDGSLVAFATDAIFATRPLDVRTGRNLGEWEATEHASGCFVQSGVYWLGEGAERVEHTRGFHLGEFTPELIRESWARGEWELTRSVRRFRGMGAAIVLGQGGWRTWAEQTRTLRLEPTGTKRRLKTGARIYGASRIRPERHLIETVPSDPHELAETLDSTPLALPWKSGRGYVPVFSDADRAETETEDALL